MILKFLRTKDALFTDEHQEQLACQNWWLKDFFQIVNIDVFISKESLSTDEHQ